MQKKFVKLFTCMTAYALALGLAMTPVGEAVGITPIVSEAAEEDFSYSVISENEKTCMITAANSALSGHVELPATLAGYTVVQVKRKAFDGDEDITGVTIPATIKTIEACAFDCCTGLNTIILDENNTALQLIDGVLYDVAKATAVMSEMDITSCVIPEGITTIAESAFERHKALTSVILPDSVTNIGARAFSLTSLTAVKLPNNLESLGRFALNMTRITEVHLPASLKTIADDAFRNCVNLNTITVDAGNTNFKMVDSALYSMDGTQLIVAEKDITGKYEVPATVTAIYGSAFSHCRQMTGISLTEGIEELRYSVFEGCGKLSDIVIPNSMKRIESCAFFDCDALTSITIPENVVMVNRLAFNFSDNLAMICNKSETIIDLSVLKQKWYNQETGEEITSIGKGVAVTTLDQTPGEGQATLIKAADGKFYYTVDGVVDTTKTGLTYIESMGGWFYLEAGAWDIEKYDFVEYGGGSFLVANGQIADLTGLVQYGDAWYYLAEGQLVDSYEGLTQYGEEWFYVRNGVLVEDYSGIKEYDGSRFLVADGRILFGYSGLYLDTDGTWYFIASGQIQTNHTGLTQYDGAWFYVENGKLAVDFIGTVTYDGAEFNIVNGMLVN